MAKRAYKLQEFVAHSSNVNCLKIGRRSSGVLVTGGDDKKVNMWAIGKPDSIMVGRPTWTPNVQQSSSSLYLTFPPALHDPDCALKVLEGRVVLPTSVTVDDVT